MTGPEHDTDRHWELWGSRDPYFGVITDPRFRVRNLTEAALQEFFASGDWQVHYVLDIIRRHLDPAFTPRRVLDFGCGVGRTLLPLARLAESAVGVDVSASMLKEAETNCRARGIQNVELLASDDELSVLQGHFDLVHSSIVFQHIPELRGRRLFNRLIALLAPGGVGALQLTYAKTLHDASDGVPPPAPQRDSAAGTSSRAKPVRTADPAPGADPDMQMNAYQLNPLFYRLQRAGVTQLFLDFTDHGGELGTFLFFRRPTDDAQVAPS